MLVQKSVSDENPALHKTLQQLVPLPQSVIELRNTVGIALGTGSVLRWVRPTHGRLLVGGAQVWCHLRLETLADPDAPWRRSER